MKTFKLFDVWLGILLFTTLLIYCLINPSHGNIIIACFIMGGWQVGSMIVHELNRWFTPPTGERRIYHWTSLLGILMALFGFASVLLFSFPLMTLFYIRLCYHEIHIKMRRPLDLLK